MGLCLEKDRGGGDKGTDRVPNQTNVKPSQEPLLAHQYINALKDPPPFPTESSTLKQLQEQDQPIQQQPEKPPDQQEPQILQQSLQPPIATNDSHTQESVEIQQKAVQSQSFNQMQNLAIAKDMSRNIHEEYQLQEKIGSGAFSEIFKATHKVSHVQRAVKVILKAKTNASLQEKIKNEIEILQQLDHPNIIKIIDVYEDEEKYFIVIELFTGGELFDYISNADTISEEVAAQIMKQIFSAVHYCHQSGFVHGDIKLDNFLLASSSQELILKLIDFGTCQRFESGVPLVKKQGSPSYIAPEVLKRSYNQKCDIWSSGVILYMLLSGSPPFDGDSDIEILQSVLEGKYSLDGEEWEQVSAQAKDLLRNLLEYDPNKRYDSQQALQHEWTQNIAKESQYQKPAVEKVIGSLKKFRAQTKVQQTLLKFCVDQISTNEEKQDLLQTFKILDVNDDGKLSKEELLQCFLPKMSEEEAKQEVERIFNEVDKDQSGVIDYNEFVLATIDKKGLFDESRLRKIFDIIDSDKSGQISVQEMRRCFKKADAELIFQSIREMDQDSDNMISFEEFVQLMAQIQ